MVQQPNVKQKKRRFGAFFFFLLSYTKNSFFRFINHFLIVALAECKALFKGEDYIAKNK